MRAVCLLFSLAILVTSSHVAVARGAVAQSPEQRMQARAVKWNHLLAVDTSFSRALARTVIHEPFPDDGWKKKENIITEPERQHQQWFKELMEDMDGQVTKQWEQPPLHGPFDVRQPWVRARREFEKQQPAGIRGPGGQPSSRTERIMSQPVEEQRDSLMHAGSHALKSKGNEAPQHPTSSTPETRHDEPPQSPAKDIPEPKRDQPFQYHAKLIPNPKQDQSPQRPTNIVLQAKHQQPPQYHAKDIPQPKHGQPQQYYAKYDRWPHHDQTPQHFAKYNPEPKRDESPENPGKGYDRPDPMPGKGHSRNPGKVDPRDSEYPGKYPGKDGPRGYEYPEAYPGSGQQQHDRDHEEKTSSHQDAAPDRSSYHDRHAEMQDGGPYEQPQDQPYPVRTAEVCVQEVARSDCQQDGAAPLRDAHSEVLEFTSTLGCCQEEEYDWAWEQDSQEGSVHVTRVQPGREAATKSLDGPQEYDLLGDNGECLWTATYHKPVAVTDITKHIGTATATCHFSQSLEQCGGPLCEGLVITVEADIFSTIAVSRHPTGKSKLDGSCQKFFGPRQFRGRLPSLETNSQSAEPQTGLLADPFTPPPASGHTDHMTKALLAPSDQPGQIRDQPSRPSNPTPGQQRPDRGPEPFLHQPPSQPRPDPAMDNVAGNSPFLFNPRQYTGSQPTTGFHDAPDMQVPPRPLQMPDSQRPPFQQWPNDPAMQQMPGGSPLHMPEDKLPSPGPANQPHASAPGYSRSQGLGNALNPFLSLKKQADSTSSQATGRGWNLFFGQSSGPSTSKSSSYSQSNTDHNRMQQSGPSMQQAANHNMALGAHGHYTTQPHSTGVSTQASSPASAQPKTAAQSGPAWQPGSATPVAPIGGSSAVKNSSNVTVAAIGSDKKTAQQLFIQQHGSQEPSYSYDDGLTQESGYFGGSATIIWGVITSVKGLQTDVDFEGGVIEHVSSFNGRPLSVAEYNSLPDEVSYVTPGSYKIVFLGDEPDGLYTRRSTDS